MKHFIKGLKAAAICTFLTFTSMTSQAQCDTIIADWSSNAPRCTGDAVDFVFTQNVYPSVTYSWNFGAGSSPTTSSAQNPSGIVYSTPGLKLVTLTITDTILNCTDIKTAGINIVELPAPAFTDNGPQCEQADINFTYTGSSNPSWLYSWDFGTGASPAVSSAQNPGGVTYSSPGTKSITLTVTNGMCAANLTQNVTVLNKPDAGFSVVSASCTDDSITFTNLGTTGATYAWDFGTGSSPATSTSEDPTNVFYSSSGSKNVRQVITLGTCSDTAYAAVNVTETPAPAFTDNGPQCEGADVNFTYTGSTGTGWTYNWDFGTGSNPSVSTGANPQGVKYTGSGTKSVSLTVTNGACSQTTSNTVTINSTPYSGITNSNPLCSNDSVNFSNTGTSGISYNWDFGSGATPASSTLENPAGIIYATGGIKTVRQIAIQGTCRDTSFASISVTEKPNPSFTTSAPQCEGAEVDFTYTGTSGTNWTYLWDFGTGATPSLATGQSPSGVSYVGSGNKTVTVTVTNQLCSESSSQVVTINPTPVSGFSSNAPGCTTDSINFLNTGTTGLTYSWDFGSGATPATSTAESPIGIIYSSSGVKSVRQVVTQGTCRDTSFLSISLTEMPAPNFTSTAPQCEGAVVDFTYTGTTGTGWNYLWDLGTGALPSLSTAQNPLGVTYTGSGTKTITLTVSNGLCSETTTQSITINPTPLAGFSSNAPGCTGDSINFLNSGTTGVTYDWDFGSGASPATSTLENPMGIIFSTAGIKTVRQIAIQGTCRDTAWSNPVLKETPNPSFSSLPGTVCEGENVTFSYNGSNGTGWTYTWDFGTGASQPTSNTMIPPVISYSSAGRKTITVSVVNQGCTESFEDTVRVKFLPISSFSTTAPTCSGDTVLFSNTGTTGLSGTNYNWDFGTGLPTSSASENPGGVVYSDPGVKSIQLIVEYNGCSDTSSQNITINETPSISLQSSTPVCAREAVSFNNVGSNGARWNFIWDFGDGSSPSISTSATPTGVRYNAGGTKVVNLTVSDANCSNSDSLSIEIYNLPMANAGPDTTICADTCTVLGDSTMAGYTYSWFPSSTLDDASISNPTACPKASINNYVLSVSDTAGCVNGDTVVVTMLPSAIARAGNDVEACEGESRQIGAALIEGQTYTWTPSDGLDSDTVPSPNASPENTTWYKVETSYKGCPAIEDSVLFTVHKNPVVSAGDDVTIARGEETQLTATGAIMYEWSPVDGLDNPGVARPIASPSKTTTYVVLFTDVNSCQSVDSITVTVVEADIWTPEAFTPNGDGKNDIFYVRTNGAAKFEFRVFNRNGEMIFRTTDPNQGWDGTQQGTGQKLPTGAYVFSAKGYLSDGNTFDQRGMINLIR